MKVGKNLGMAAASHDLGALQGRWEGHRGEQEIWVRVVDTSVVDMSGLYGGSHASLLGGL